MNRFLILLAVAVSVVAGCGDDDARVAQVAREAADRQADQNREMARLHQTVAAAHERLVEAEADSRRELISLQQDLRADQSAVNDQRDELERERQAIAAQRHRDPIVANAVIAVGLTLACLLPLVVCCYVLHSLRGNPEAADIAEVLIEELASAHPTLLPLGEDRVPGQPLLASADDSPATDDQQDAAVGESLSQSNPESKEEL